MKRKTNKDKGFTLVELIVVLVILAILAAILVPALLGYIDRAKEKQYVLNAKSALTATQAELSSLYGEDKDWQDNGKFVRSEVVSKTADTPSGSKFYIEKKTLAENADLAAKHTYYTVTKAIYYEDGYYCQFDGKTWTTTQTDPGTSSMIQVYPAASNSSQQQEPQEP